MPRFQSNPRTALAVGALTLCALLGAAAAPAAAQNFPTPPACPDDDVISSIGAFIVWVEPAYRPLVNTMPGWDMPAPNHWTSPPMLDPMTRIGHSCVHQDDDATDLGGAIVGIAGTMVSDADFAFVPAIGFTEGPPGTNEVHTQIWQLEMDEPDCQFKLRIGTGAGVSPPSFGEVEDNTPGPPDFPAESFFDIFFELDTPFFGGSTLYNRANDPMVVVNDALDQLPPRVIYIHGETPAVPIYFKDGPEAGERFGFLRLAGHGSSYGCGQEIPDCPNPPFQTSRCPDAQKILDTLSELAEQGALMDCPECKDEAPPTDGGPEPVPPDCTIWIILVIILVILVIILVIVILRRR